MEEKKKPALSNKHSLTSATESENRCWSLFPVSIGSSFPSAHFSRHAAPVKHRAVILLTKPNRSFRVWYVVYLHMTWTSSLKYAEDPVKSVFRERERQRRKIMEASWVSAPLASVSFLPVPGWKWLVGSGPSSRLQCGWARFQNLDAVLNSESATKTPLFISHRSWKTKIHPRDVQPYKIEPS